MEIIYRKPRSGKTMELIKRCAENGGYIVCKDEKSARSISEMAQTMGFNIPFPITFSEFFCRKYYSRGIKKFYIDNADQLIKEIAGGIEVDSIVMDNLEEEEK